MSALGSSLPNRRALLSLFLPLRSVLLLPRSELTPPTGLAKSRTVQRLSGGSRGQPGVLIWGFYTVRACLEEARPRLAQGWRQDCLPGVEGPTSAPRSLPQHLREHFFSLGRSIFTGVKLDFFSKMKLKLLYLWLTLKSTAR